MSLLRVDMRIDCNDGNYVVLQIAAGVLLLVFVLGLPLGWLYILLSKKESSTKVISNYDDGPEEQASLEAVQLDQFSFLVGSYKPEYFLWEVTPDTQLRLPRMAEHARSRSNIPSQELLTKWCWCVVCCAGV